MSENSLLFSYAGHYCGSTPVPRHSHRGTELVLVIAGSCVTEFDGGVSLAARPGTVYITPPELAHTQNNTPDCETLYAVMELSGPGFDNRLRSIETGDDPVLRQWFAQLQLLNREITCSIRLRLCCWRSGPGCATSRPAATGPALFIPVCRLRWITLSGTIWTTFPSPNWPPAPGSARAI